MANLQFRWPENTSYDIGVSDIVGERVFFEPKIKGSQKTVELNDVNAGVCLVHVYIDNHTHFQKNHPVQMVCENTIYNARQFLIFFPIEP